MNDLLLPVDLNRASRNELLTLPGLDSEIIDRILTTRPYTSLDQFHKKCAISKNQFKAIRPYLLLGQPLEETAGPALLEAPADERVTGLARQDVLAARTILADQKAQAPSGQQAGLTVLLTRLDLVLINLPASPVTAADDLEIAWRQLAAGLANNPDATFNTQTNGLSPAATPSPSGTPTFVETQLTPLNPAGTPTLTGTLLAAKPSATPAAVGKPTFTGTPAQASTPTQIPTP